MSINFGISGWSSLRKLRQVVNAHLFQHFILLILPVVLQCASNPVLLEIINLGSEEKGKVHKKINTHSNVSNEVDSKLKQTELTYNETQFPKIPIQRETFSFYLHRSKN